jgi:hypothetical protein
MIGSNLSKGYSQQENDWLLSMLREKASPQLKEILSKPDEYRVQVVYTQIDRDKRNKPHFTSYKLTPVDHYFYPASTVKLPTALLALEKLHQLNVKGLNMYSSMLTDSGFSRQLKISQDLSSDSKKPSVAHYLKKIFIVSDNDAYNRLYEFNGQQFLNERLWALGFKNTRITHRFQYPLTEEENRHTNPIRFYNADQLVYEQKGEYSNVKFNYPNSILVGEKHMDNDDKLWDGPMDFSRKNNFPLTEQQDMLRRVLFPESVPRHKRFKLKEEDYALLYKYMSMHPAESDYPKYDPKEFFESYAKFFFYRAGKQKKPDYIKIFNKAGWSHGFLTDNAYIIDLKNNVEFLVSATIYVNSDGVINDNKYEYEEKGYPFFKEVGEILYHHELARKRYHDPDLKRFE